MRINSIGINNKYYSKNPVKNFSQRPMLSFSSDSFVRENEANYNKKYTFKEKKKIVDKYCFPEISNYLKALTLNSKKFSRFMDFCAKQDNDTKLALQYVNFSQEEEELYYKLRKLKFSPEFSIEVMNYSPKEQKRFQEIYEKDISNSFYYSLIVKFDDEKFERYKHLKSLNYDQYMAYNLARLDKKNYDAALDMIAQGVNPVNFVFVRDDNIYETINSEIKKGTDVRYIKAILKETSKMGELHEKFKKAPVDEVIKEVAFKRVSDNIYDYFIYRTQGAKGAKKETKDFKNRITSQEFELGKYEYTNNYIYDKKDNLQTVICTSKNDELEFNFEDKKLKNVKYTQKGVDRNLDINSPEFTDLFYLGDGVISTILTLLHVKAVSQVPECDYKDLNQLLYGEQREENIRLIEEFNKLYPDIKLVTDYSINPLTIQYLIDFLDTQPDEKLPPKIYITNFLEPNASGQYDYEDNSIAFKDNYGKIFSEYIIGHELQHFKDYTTGLLLGQNRTGEALVFDKKIMSDINGRVLYGIVVSNGKNVYFIDDDIEELISKHVSEYGSSCTGEYIAEFGAMLRRGVIKAQKTGDDIVYSIKKLHVDNYLHDIEITKEEFAKLIKLYLVLGGTPEFNNNFIAFDDEEIISVTQEEAIRTEL